MTEAEKLAISSKRKLSRGNLFIWKPNNRPAERSYVRITRVARDSSWADIHVEQWDTNWSKRIQLVDGELPGEWEARFWNHKDLWEQKEDAVEVIVSKSRPAVGNFGLSGHLMVLP